MTNTTTNWICTDPDTYQYTRCFSDTEFEFVQMEQFDTDEYYAYTGCVDVMEYLFDKEGREELRIALGMYGYTGWLDLEAHYGEDTFRIAAECIFEAYMCSIADHVSETEEDCKAWLDYYMRQTQF